MVQVIQELKELEDLKEIQELRVLHETSVPKEVEDLGEP